MELEGNDDGQFNRGTDRGARADGVADEVVTGADERAHRGSMDRTKHWP